ncbi:CoA-binding protein [Dysosmobacter sp.]|jgi:predicted CoA-binding protein|uniref:CoA-binding protein n=1 Tax=Dysosmobacter sp. TaxID=2591382 RepID=UPI002D7EECF5|nr:CoA-binding protein [uncultured Oscillibacter sp.]
MDLQEIMNQQSFAVVGDTVNPEKYAAKIKTGLLSQGYTVHAVGKELSSLNDIPGSLDIIDLCIRPDKGLALLQENRKPCKCVVLQPGADSPEIIAWLEEQHQPYLQGCLLVGMRLYPRNGQ